jgi:capsid portal protein
MKKKVGRPARTDAIQVSFRFDPETVDIIDEYWEATGATSRTEAAESLIQLMNYYTKKI